MEIRILGPFELAGDDGQLVDVGGHLPQALLVALALAEGRPVPADQLLDQVWPGGGPGDRNRLQVHISRLRKALGSDRILTRAGGYSLQSPAWALDAARFGQLAASGRAALRRQDPARAGRLLGQALGLWRGRPLAEFADAGFAAGVITRLEEARLTAAEDRIDAELMLGGPELAAVVSVLKDSRLVTVTGTGGVGKTRLAIEVARGLLGRYRDGALIPLDQPARLAQIIREFAL